ncbi:MAG: hypothetical protein HOH17_00200 [Halieaceae bacterium]|nr:hypothetical protein [Halieaceae bacterium]
MKQQLYTEEESMRFSWLLIPILALPLIIAIVASSDFKLRTFDSPCETVRIFLEDTDRIRVSKDASTLVIVGSVFSEWKLRSVKQLAPNQLRVKASTLFTPATIAKCFERTVALYRPITMVLFLDDTDGLQHAEATFDALDEIDDLRAYWSVSPSFMVVPPAITPALKSQAKALRDFKDSLATWMKNRAGITMLDINPLLATNSGNINPLLFWPDRRTLGKEGCKRLQGALLGYAGVKSPTTDVTLDGLSS